ncbi:hypothetical protein HY249_02825 [Candidatus Azambacteria bacterium]|nr:hypothetical protein [Candidatus Azambacteria bacterium]
MKNHKDAFLFFILMIFFIVGFFVFFGDPDNKKQFIYADLSFMLLPADEESNTKVCDNYQDIRSFEKPIPVVWTAEFTGCLSGCIGAHFSRMPSDLNYKYPSFAGYYKDDQVIQKEFLKYGTLLKVYGEWMGVGADHSNTVFNKKCVPTIDIERIETVEN